MREIIVTLSLAGDTEIVNIEIYLVYTGIASYNLLLIYSTMTFTFNTTGRRTQFYDTWNQTDHFEKISPFQMHQRNTLDGPSILSYHSSLDVSINIVRYRISCTWYLSRGNRHPSDAKRCLDVKNFLGFLFFAGDDSVQIDAEVLLLVAVLSCELDGCLFEDHMRTER